MYVKFIIYKLIQEVVTFCKSSLHSSVFVCIFSGNALVYGHTLDAYCCIQTLMTMGVPGNRIIMVQPPLNYQVGQRSNNYPDKKFGNFNVLVHLSVYPGCIILFYAYLRRITW